ncbi:MAG: hypothetical protein P0S96_03590 [Simkaniaceae bacterium]|nr:hypothetical protein [Candidatus Sacchlamyda saccharinae]
MIRAPIWIFFLLALAGFYLFSSFHLFYFAPVLAPCIQRYPLLPILWTSCFIGLFSDLLSFDTHFGLYALLTLLTALISYRFKRWLYEERLFSLPLLTGLISSIFFVLKGMFLVRAPLWMPLVDATYAFFWFSCPLFLYTSFKRWRLS